MTETNQAVLEAEKEALRAQTELEQAQARARETAEALRQAKRMAEPRTELTREQLLLWADKIVAECPTHLEATNEPDPKRPGYMKRGRVQTTRAYVFATVCQLLDECAYQECDRDLLIAIHEWFWSGITPNKDLSEIDGLARMLEWANDNLEPDTSLEELLEQLEWSQDHLDRD